jgi:hypothetical protein
MAADEPALQLFDAVSERSPDLVGYEPHTVDFDPSDPEQRRQLFNAWQDARRRGKRVLLVRDHAGRITLWQRSLEFWGG